MTGCCRSRSARLARMAVLRAVAALVWLVPFAVSVRPASAQTFEAVGIRALGMGGAFVAVADDATATYWNPAGLGTGAYFSAALEHDTTDTISQRGQPLAGIDGARRDTETGFAMAFPALGLSYYNLQMSEVAPTPAAGSAGSRQELRPAGVSSLLTREFGVTLVQTLLPGLVVGSTLKLVRGTVSAGPGGVGGTAAQALDQAAALSGRTSGVFDLDLGAMETIGPFRLGIVARNVRQPQFQGPAGVDPVTLRRQVRVGAAVAPELSGRGRLQGLTIAVDADLTRSLTVFGERRHVAAGVEAWLLQRRLGIRGGIRVNTLNQALPVGTAGISVALRTGMYLDGEISRGEDAAARGWGVGARVTF